MIPRKRQAEPRRVFVVDPSSAPTGGLRGAINIGRSVAPQIEVRLVLGTSSQVEGANFAMFDDVIRVPMHQIRRSARDLALYGPSLLAAGIKLRRLLRDDDVLVINDFYLLHGWLVRRLGFRGRIVTWVRIDPLVFPAALRQAWIAAMVDSSDAVVAVSNFIAGRLQAVGIAPHLLYDPVDPSLEGIVGKAGDRRMQRIVQIANFTRGKGQDDAIAAFARIAGSYPHAVLALHGGDLTLQRNSDYRAELERQAEATGFGDRILFGGFVRDVGTALVEADVALVLSHRESFSLACLEASQCGLPVIATRCGGPEEIVQDGETGLLCDVGDVDAIAAAMARLLSDPKGAIAMGARGAASVGRRFSSATFAAGLRTLLLPDH